MSGAMASSLVGTGYVGRGPRRVIVHQHLDEWHVCVKRKGDQRHVIEAVFLRKADARAWAKIVGKE